MISMGSSMFDRFLQARHEVAIVGQASGRTGLSYDIARNLLNVGFDPRLFYQLPSMESGWLDVLAELPNFNRNRFQSTNSRIMAEQTFSKEAVIERPRVSAAQIHNELFATADDLLVDVEDFSLSAPLQSQRIKTLKAMGFTVQQEVVAHEKAVDEFEKEKRRHTQRFNDHKSALRYRLMFPNYKFIGQAGLVRVCAKYGLEIRPTEEFIGTIPDKNVADMARFREQLQNSKHKNEVLDYGIAAPAEQFIERRYMGGTMTEAEYKQWLIDDPIMFCSVKGGFLIITAWGDEAKDPDVLNEQFN